MQVQDLTGSAPAAAPPVAASRERTAAPWLPIERADGNSLSYDDFLARYMLVVFPPSDTPYLYPRVAFPNHSTVDDPVMQNRERFPLLAKATLYRTVLKPGDMIFVPARWWHAARALSTSISVCTNMLDPSNWQGFQDEVAAEEAKKSPEAGARLGDQLARVDRILTRLERFQQNSPGLARALVLPAKLAPLSAEAAPDPSRRQLRIRIPTS